MNRKSPGKKKTNKKGTDFEFLSLTNLMKLKMKFKGTPLKILGYKMINYRDSVLKELLKI